jgi:hypothetical protein
MAKYTELDYVKFLKKYYNEETFKGKGDYLD